MKPAERPVPRERKKYRNRFIAALVGTALVALCCFTPILVIVLTAAGLTAFTPYLDYVLFPALTAFIILAAVSFLKWRKACRRPE